MERGWDFKSFPTEDEARRYMAEGAKSVPSKPMKFKPHRRPGQSDAAFLKEQKILLRRAHAEMERQGLARYEGNTRARRCQLLLGVPAIIELDLELSAHLRAPFLPLGIEAIARMVARAPG